MENLNDDALNKILEKIEAKIEDTVNKKVAEVIKQVTAYVSDEEMLTTKEAAKHLGCTTRAIYLYKDTGRLNFYIRGGQILFKLEDLQAFIKKGKSKLPRL